MSKKRVVVSQPGVAGYTTTEQWDVTPRQCKKKYTPPKSTCRV